VEDAVADVSFVETFPKQSTTQAQVEAERDFKRTLPGVTSSVITQDDSNWILTTIFSTPTNNAGVAPIPTVPQGSQPGVQAQRFKALLDLIARAEGTANRPLDGYNTSLGFGIFTGGEQNLVGMTLLQIDVLQTQMLQNPQNNLDSSALGRYQIVQKTLRGLKTQLGLAPTALYDQNLQDQLGVQLILEKGRNPDGLRAEWAGLKKVSTADILGAFDTDGSAEG
jgi:muramidase (phage lysozyme)